MDGGRGQEAPVAHVRRSGEGTDRPLLWPVTAGRLHEGKVHTHRRKPKGTHTPLSRLRAPHDRLQMPAVLGTPETCGRILTHGRGFRHGYGGVWACAVIFHRSFVVNRKMCGEARRGVISGVWRVYARVRCLGLVYFGPLFCYVSPFFRRGAYRRERRKRLDPLGCDSFYPRGIDSMRCGICPLGGLR